MKTKRLRKLITKLRPPKPQPTKENDLLRYYLVDYENTSEHGLAGIEALHDTDIVCIFYSDHMDKLSFDAYHAILATKAAVFDQHVLAETPNALDFQLDTYLGAIIERYKSLRVEYHIVSKDKGYENVIAYWKAQGFSISLIPNIGNLPETVPARRDIPPSLQAFVPKAKQTTQPKSKKKADRRNNIRNAIKDQKKAERIIQIVETYKTKTQIHNVLRQTYPTGYKEIYDKIKKFLD